MEEIAGFEERLVGLRQRGEELVSGCSERLRARLRQQTQSHLQGARDSYSAICSTAQRVSLPASRPTLCQYTRSDPPLGTDLALLTSSYRASLHVAAPDNSLRACHLSHLIYRTDFSCNSRDGLAI